MKASILEGIEESNKDLDRLFDAVLAKNQIARMIRDKNINWQQLEYCLKDIEHELGCMNQPTINSIIKSDYSL